MLQETEYFDPENVLTETTHVSFHRRTPTQMALLHKGVLKANGHNVVNHETNGDGSHTIVHVNKRGATRVSKVEPIHNRKGYASKITDQPTKHEDHLKYSKSL